MAKYDTETLYLAETIMSGVLLQVALDSLAELVELTGDASSLEPFFQQILDRDWSGVLVGGHASNPLRMKMAMGLLKQRLPEAVAAMREYARLAEEDRKSRVAN